MRCVGSCIEFYNGGWGEIRVLGFRFDFIISLLCDCGRLYVIFFFVI